MPTLVTNPHAPNVPGSVHRLPLLADPDRYRACVHDLLTDADDRAYWIGLFQGHFPSLLAEAVREALDRGVSESQAQRSRDEAQQAFGQYLDVITRTPDRFGRLDILTICYAREHILRAVQFDDPYRLAKQRENAAALPHLPALLRQLDALSSDDRLLALARGAFAGNIFDLGAVKTAAMFQHGPVDFSAVLSKLKPRPWLVDDFDLLAARLQQRPYRKAAVFVDNAGPDIVLGMIPLVRELLQHGTRVIVAANSTPTLNDVTADELRELLTSITAFDSVLDSALRQQRLQVIASGNGVPLIDLTLLSAELVDAVSAEPADLLVLEGMGRALESNYNTRFTCDTLKVAMIKDPGVARMMGGDLYDLVLRFEPGTA